MLASLKTSIGIMTSAISPQMWYYFWFTILPEEKGGSNAVVFIWAFLT